jgi:TonB family protein
MGRHFTFANSRHLLALLVLLLRALLAAPDAECQSSDPLINRSLQAKLDLLASHAAQRIREAKLDEPEPKVLVIDFFRNSAGSSSELGTLLADRFSDTLAGYSTGLKVLDRRALKEYLINEWTTLEDLQTQSVCLRVGRQLGGTGVILGTLDEDNGYIRLTMHLEGFGRVPKDADPMNVYDESVRFPSNQELVNLLLKQGPNYRRTADEIPEESGVYRAGVNGLSLPTCIRCKQPNYTDDARASNFQGTLRLSILVTSEGKVTDVYVLKGAPFGLTATSIDAVKQWKLSPAELDGKPVAARVEIETTFHLY